MFGAPVIPPLLFDLRDKRVYVAGHNGMVGCRRLFGTSLPASLMANIGKGLTMRWLETTALSAMTAAQSEREPRDVRFGTTRGSLSTFLLSRSWRYQLAELNNHLTNQIDVLTVPLPERLWFLYPVLRLPLWAWRHCSPTRNYKDPSA